MDVFDMEESLLQHYGLEWPKSQSAAIVATSFQTGSSNGMAFSAHRLRYAGWWAQVDTPSQSPLEFGAKAAVRQTDLCGALAIRGIIRALMERSLAGPLTVFLPQTSYNGLATNVLYHARKQRQTALTGNSPNWINSKGHAVTAQPVLETILQYESMYGLTLLPYSVPNWRDGGRFSTRSNIEMRRGLTTNPEELDRPQRLADDMCEKSHVAGLVGGNYEDLFGPRGAYDDWDIERAQR
jgi:hypothetical protein